MRSPPAPKLRYAPWSTPPPDRAGEKPADGVPWPPRGAPRAGWGFLEGKSLSQMDDNYRGTPIVTETPVYCWYKNWDIMGNVHLNSDLSKKHSQLYKMRLKYIFKEKLEKKTCWSTVTNH